MEPPTHNARKGGAELKIRDPYPNPGRVPAEHPWEGSGARGMRACAGDYTNFVLTAHVGLKVPKGKCWIDVGDVRTLWECAIPTPGAAPGPHATDFL